MSCPEDRENNKNESEKQESDEAKDAEPVEVHSANAWETADLGDDDRKNKFLRLMGAGKKGHHGRFVIGDHEPSHARSSCNTAELQQNLEEQYQQSLTHRLQGGRRGHIGLGFHEEENENAEGQDETKGPEDTSKDIIPEKATKDEDDNYEESEEGEEEEKEEGEEEEEEEREKEDKTSKRNAKKRESTEESNADAPHEKKTKFLKATS